IDHITPGTPRALYFNDDVYIGWVQGGPILEVASVDPQFGGMFYTLEQEKRDRPQFQREFNSCLLCHQSSFTGGVPGFMTCAVLADRPGDAIPPAGVNIVTDQTPMKERWGGWYVTGTHGDLLHWGNLAVPVTSNTIGNAKAYVARLDLKPGANLTS